MDVREALGRGVGGILAPLVAEASLVRGAKVIHADGVVYRGEVHGVAAADPLGPLGRALQGAALVRFSSAFRRYRAGQDPRDVFGVAVRFGGGQGAPAQDLIFGTFRHLWQIPIAPLLTDPRDFLANEYYAVLPFRIPGTETHFTFRLVPESRSPEGTDHVDRLDRAVAAGTAILRLEARALERGGTFSPVAAITVQARVSPQPEVLRFDPFRAGAGVVPVGFFQAVRAAIYPASQLGRDVARGPRGG